MIPKLKNLIFVKGSSTLGAFFYFASAFAQNSFPSASYSVLLQPSASLASLSDAGASASGNASMVDVNPALLPALKKQYSFFGGIAAKKGVNLWEAGVFDSSTTSVATVFRVRQTLPSHTLDRGRSLTLGLGYQIPKLENLSIGVSGDYAQLNMPSFTSFSRESPAISNFRMGLGLFYQLNVSTNPIFLGVSTRGLFDRYNPSLFDAGVSTVLWEGLYTVNVDALVNANNGYEGTVMGVSVAANRFLDLKGSFGYHPSDNRLFWGAGIFFNSPVLHIYYTLAKNRAGDTTLQQTTGLEMSLTL